MTASDEQHENEIPIPQPPRHPFLGNFSQVDPNYAPGSFQKLAELYGEIYQLELGERILVISSQKLMNEICDQTRFHKALGREMTETRALIGDGLVSTVHEDGGGFQKEEIWWRAHRLLVPAFGPLRLREMFDDMMDISSQLILRWDRLGPENIIEPGDEFTRATFDTIGLCSFGYRFNEFYTNEAHPFVKQMANVLRISSRRANRPIIANKLYRWEEQERQSDIKKMHDLVHFLVAERKAHPKPEAKDLLNLVLHSVDRESGLGLSDENIMYNMVTFLVAGHETTRSTLSFLWYHLLKNPQCLHRAQKEVDDVVGDSMVTSDMLPKLTYIDACIKETLRLTGPVPVFALLPKKETFLDGGKWRVREGDTIIPNLRGIHTDPKVWGEDNKSFKPERFLDGKFQALPPNAWKPFGNGLRACIGRGFAEQQMLLNTAMILQRFSPQMVDPNYDLRIKSHQTIQPDGFFFRVSRRPGKSWHTGIPGGALRSQSEQGPLTASPKSQGTVVKSSSEPVKIFFGGNSGTCEGFAQMLQAKLSESGITADISNLDSAEDSLSTKNINAIITASYEGKPPDNAKKFVSWLENAKGSTSLKAVKYTVLGVGNPDWTSTFHKVPILVNDQMQRLGAKSVVPAHFTDVKSDLIGPFEEWSEKLIAQLTGCSRPTNNSPALKVTIEPDTIVQDNADEKMVVGTVLVNKQLADTSVGLEKKHIEIQLPKGTSYEPGDYLVVQPRNSTESIRKVIHCFNLDERANISVDSSAKKFLPTKPTPIDIFLQDRVELGTLVTRKQLATIASHANTAELREKIDNDATCSEMQKNRYTIIDVLLEHSITLPFEQYVEMLLPLTPRQYSISSSPLTEGSADDVVVASLTYDVHTGPALSGHGTFQGASSTYLATRTRGDRILCTVRPINVGFRLPSSLTTPLVLFAAGTGIAPMRALLSHRAAIAAARGVSSLGPAILFYGCRDARKDFLYKSELERWREDGVVTDIIVAQSWDPESGREGHPKYVHDAVWAHRDRYFELFSQGGRVFVCGSAAKLGQSCAKVCKEIYMEKTGKTEVEAEEWLESVRSDRYISDVY